MFPEVTDLPFIETVKVTVATVVRSDCAVPFDPAFALPEDESISAVPKTLLNINEPPVLLIVVVLPDSIRTVWYSS